MAVTIEQLFQQGIGAHNAGNLQEAERVYKAILQSLPRHPDANHNLGLIAISVNQIEAALPLFKIALDVNPYVEPYWVSYIDALVKAKRLKDAKQAIKKAKKKGFGSKKLQALLSQSKGVFDTKASPQEKRLRLLEHYQKGRFSDAEKLATAISQEFPSDNFSWKILGAVFKSTGRNSEAVNANQKAVALIPDDAEAHYNLGNTLEELGRLEEAEASYTQAIALKPNYPEARHNLVHMFSSYTSHKNSSQPIVVVDQEIKKIDLIEMSSRVISNDGIVQIFDKCSNIIKKYDLEIGTHLSQVYRRNSIDLNCVRHKSVFDTYNVIPKFCFGCYKVQVEPRSVLELIKLFVVFDQIKLVKNNTRKCMVEMRPEISGFYKGLIYCSSLEEAYQIAGYLEGVVKERIGIGLPLAIKRGCSEYSIAFPDYKAINKSGAQLMNYQDSWKLIEDDYDSIHPSNENRIISSSLSCLSLSDILIIRNWFDYSKGIGDSSIQLLSLDEVNSQQMFKSAQARLETHPWREPALEL